MKSDSPIRLIVSIAAITLLVIGIEDVAATPEFQDSINAVAPEIRSSINEVEDAFAGLVKAMTGALGKVVAGLDKGTVVSALLPLQVLFQVARAGMSGSMAAENNKLLGYLVGGGAGAALLGMGGVPNIDMSLTWQCVIAGGLAVIILRL